VTRVLAAYLVASGPAVKASVDPRTPGTEGLGPVRPAAILARSVTATRRERLGIEAVRNAGRKAWDIDKQQRGEGR